MDNCHHGNLTQQDVYAAAARAGVSVYELDVHSARAAKMVDEGTLTLEVAQRSVEAWITKQLRVPYDS